MPPSAADTKTLRSIRAAASSGELTKVPLWIDVENMQVLSIEPDLKHPGAVPGPSRIAVIMGRSLSWSTTTIQLSNGVASEITRKLAVALSFNVETLWSCNDMTWSMLIAKQFKRNETQEEKSLPTVTNWKGDVCTVTVTKSPNLPAPLAVLAKWVPELERPKATRRVRWHDDAVRS